MYRYPVNIIRKILLQPLFDWLNGVKFRVGSGFGTGSELIPMLIHNSHGDTGTHLIVVVPVLYRSDAVHNLKHFHLLNCIIISTANS